MSPPSPDTRTGSFPHESRAFAALKHFSCSLLFQRLWIESSNQLTRAIMFVLWLRDFVRAGDPSSGLWVLRDATALVQDEGGGWGCTCVLLAGVLLRCDEFLFSCVPKPPSQERAGLVRQPRPLRLPATHHTALRGRAQLHARGVQGLAPRDSEPHSQTEMFMPATLPLGMTTPGLEMDA